VYHERGAAVKQRAGKDRVTCFTCRIHAGALRYNRGRMGTSRFILEAFGPLVLVAIIGGASFIAGRSFSRRFPSIRIPLLAVGFAVLAYTVLSYGWAVSRAFFFPYYGPLALKLSYGASFLLPGVLAGPSEKTVPHKHLPRLLAAAVALFILADHGYYALHCLRLYRLDGRVVNGVTLQSKGYSCVPASLATLLRRWGYEITESEAAFALHTTRRRGTDLKEIPRALERLCPGAGMQAILIHTDFEELRRLDVPVLLQGWIAYNPHSTALLGMTDTEVIVGDPISGIVRCTPERWKRTSRWNGDAVLVAPDFLHTFYPGDPDPRAHRLFEALQNLGCTGDAAWIRAFQDDHGLEPLGCLDWKTILVLDGLTGPPERPRLSHLPHGSGVATQSGSQDPVRFRELEDTAAKHNELKSPSGDVRIREEGK
jgi:hypothetical protein